MKTCTKCNVAQPVDQFGVDRKAPDGLFYWCKACSRAHSRSPEARARAATNARRRRAENPEKSREADRRYTQRPDTKEKKAALFAAWYAKVKDTPEFKAKNTAKAKAWAARNQDRRRDYDNARRITKRTGSPSAVVDRAMIYERDCYICWICGDVCDPDHADWKWRPSFDHVLALSEGGQHAEDNIRTAHRSCNSRRGSLRRWERLRDGEIGYPEPSPRAAMPPRKPKPAQKDPGRRKRGATVCRNGHTLSGENLYVTKDGRRRCKICAKSAGTQQAARKRELYRERMTDPVKRAEANERARRYARTDQRKAWQLAYRDRRNELERRNRKTATVPQGESSSS